MKTIVFACSVVLLALASNQLIALDAQPQQTLTQQHDVVAVKKVNLNQATAEQLTVIPGIGSQKAQAIQSYIAEHGAIRSEQQLTEVRGIGATLAATVAQYVHFDE